MTLPFDYRLLVETKWRSFPSSIHSIAYYFSRYTTLVFLTLYLTVNATSEPLVSLQACEKKVKITSLFFILSQIASK